jgi:UDP-glucose 4-epimerase
MSKNKILVTGGTGYIGSHTIVELQAKGFEVIVIDSLRNSFAGVLDQVEKINGIKPKFYQFDLCDKTALDNFFVTYVSNFKIVITWFYIFYGELSGSICSSTKAGTLNKHSYTNQF